MPHVIAILCVKEFTCPARGNNRVLKFGIKSWSFVTQNWGLLQEVKSIKKNLDLIAYELTSSDCCESFRKAADFIQLLSNFRSLFT